MVENHPDLTIVIPTYKEAANLAPLTERIFNATHSAGISTELIFVDDDSQDGTEAKCKELTSNYNVRLIVRKGVRGLATAVVDGLKEARGRFLLSMDADLSHPPETIPEMFRLLKEGAEFVLGSRYIKGGGVEEGWGIPRWINSKVATVLALPLTPVRDALSGFFALPRTTFLKATELSPLGYKIALELLVKARPQRIVEVPITFEKRKFGKSKLSLRVQVQYLRHLRRLYRYRYPLLSEMLHFLFVGGLGFLVDFSLYYEMQTVFGLHHLIARMISFVCAATHNWFLNRNYTFVYGRQQRPLGQWALYLGIVATGLVLSVGTYTVLTTSTLLFADRRYSAFIIGVALTTAFNFFAARFYVFRHISPELNALPRGARTR
jgi:dolichol-phosphate mannosyltransferase